jgi:hypothetical protein
MRIESQVTVCALNDRHGASFARRQPTLDVPSPIPSGHGVRKDAHHLSEQFPVEGEREAQGKRHRKHELSQRHVGQNVLCEVKSALVHASAEAAWARRARLAREATA